MRGPSQEPSLQVEESCLITSSLDCVGFHSRSWPMSRLFSLDEELDMIGYAPSNRINSQDTCWTAFQRKFCTRFFGKAELLGEEHYDLL